MNGRYVNSDGSHLLGYLASRRALEDVEINPSCPGIAANWSG